jgi:hypothetical protein
MKLPIWRLFKENACFIKQEWKTLVPLTLQYFIVVNLLGLVVDPLLQSWEKYREALHLLPAEHLKIVMEVILITPLHLIISRHIILKEPITLNIIQNFKHPLLPRIVGIQLLSFVCMYSMYYLIPWLAELVSVVVPEVTAKVIIIGVLILLIIFLYLHIFLRTEYMITGIAVGRRFQSLSQIREFTQKTAWPGAIILLLSFIVTIFSEIGTKAIQLGFNLHSFNLTTFIDESSFTYPVIKFLLNIILSMSNTLLFFTYYFFYKWNEENRFQRYK